ncbi:putative retroelement pol polyprotein [Senna tora]|uniref:Putative retroelement pol polyprotein n=1 Tax=Senna tora TaxID=362788 RepID=A0A834WV33_9FABA|nr:putative retroelement pol polyprotein [Senna tora]
MEDSCFKKHGQPEWHKEWKAQKGKKGSYSNNVTEAQTTEASSSVANSKDVSNFSEMFQRELQKYLKGKPSGAENSTSTSCFADFAGASSHITGNISLFSQIKEVKGSHTVNLPNGSVKNVSHIGEVVINSKILLKDVLYVPEFRYNLISVHRLAGSSDMKFIFDTAQCIMQYLLSSQVLAIGRVEKHLYLLDSEDNRNIFSLDNASISVDIMLACKEDKKDVHWHARLGHPSVNEEKVFISRDVVFYETQFPFKEVVDQEKSIPRSSHDSLFEPDLVAEKYADAEDFFAENTSIPVAEIPQSVQEDSDSVEEGSVIPLDESIEVVPQETRRSR